MREPDIRRLIDSYPRSRPALPPGQAAIYEAEYKRNRTGGDAASAAAQRLEQWMHRQIVGDPPPQLSGPTLELGAGTLNHLPFEPNAAFSAGYDIIEPQKHLYEDSPHLGRVRSCYADLADVPPDRRYARVIGVAVLEHLPELPRTLARCGLILSENGYLRQGIPSEGGFLWGLAWRFSTGLSYRLRTGYSYANLMRHEHLSSAAEILAIVGWLFERVKVRRFPALGPQASFYTFIDARDPHFDRCHALLESAG